MEKNKYGFFPGYEPAWMTIEGANNITREERIAANKLAEEQGQAAEVRSRHPEMQVRRKHRIDLLKETA